jgi:7-cyano-7-deazaguanine synthase
MARAIGFEIHALSFDYGQRHAIELEAARRVGACLGVAEHHVVRIGLGGLGGSALTDDAIEVPKNTEPGAGPIPPTYVPARNTVFLSVALGLAEAVGARDLFFGANALDYSGYPDCRPAFVEAFERLANVATAAGVEGGDPFRIHAPLMALHKADIIRKGIELGVDFSVTHSCYDPVGEAACGRCESCTLRKRGFAEAEVDDPTTYAG